MSQTTGRRVVAALAGALIAATVIAPTASARDTLPCHSPKKETFSWAGRQYNVDVRTCPLLNTRIPIYQRTTTSSRIVGWLIGGEYWFVNEAKSKRVSRGSRVNSHWASTRAPNGRWGWVNESYFNGTRTDEDDRGLVLVPPLRCRGTCNPPPWWDPRA